MAASSQDEKLEIFLQWLKVNGVELRGCSIAYSDSTKGLGVFSSDSAADEIQLVVPLDLAITPMRVLEDPLLGAECRAMLEKGEVDDRFLLMLFITVQRSRKSSSWKPYLDMLPVTFGNPLWFSEDDLLELKGTTLHHASKIQKKNLKSLFDEKVKKLVEKLLDIDGNPESKVRFEDFLWANSVFWTRALNIPLPHSYVFPKGLQEEDQINSMDSDPDVNDSANQVTEVESSLRGETVWVEGLVPGIDFCNHDLKAAATWEVDGNGSTTGVPFSMYLSSAGQNLFQGEREISISYGNKGNEELLYLYGFVIQDNPDDYLMIHYPLEAISDVPFSETKGQLLQAQKGELRCLLPRNLLVDGFFPDSISREANKKETHSPGFNFSWSGRRKMPSYTSKLVFSQEFICSLRTIAMKESELFEVSLLLEELVANRAVKQPFETEVRAAIWEVCGDSGAFQLLVDLLNMKMLELEEGTGTEESDIALLKLDNNQNILTTQKSSCNGSVEHCAMSRNKWCSIVYRQGQKQLSRRFLKEAEHALELALIEGN